MHIITVCGNGIGSSLMLAGKVEELCEEEGIKADVESMDLNGASSANPDLFITVKELDPRAPRQRCDRSQLCEQEEDPRRRPRGNQGGRR